MSAWAVQAGSFTGWGVRELCFLPFFFFSLHTVHSLDRVLLQLVTKCFSAAHPYLLMLLLEPDVSCHRLRDLLHVPYSFSIEQAGDPPLPPWAPRREGTGESTISLPWGSQGGCGSAQNLGCILRLHPLLGPTAVWLWVVASPQEMQWFHEVIGDYKK